MSTPGEELGAIDFESVIGGPLIAVVHAQSQAAIATVDFIKSVGFDDNDEVVNVEFKYSKATPEGTPQDYALSVPILTIVPIPFLRIEETNIEFNAKIASVEYTESSTDNRLGVNLSARASWGIGSAKLKVSYSHQRSTRAGEKVTRDYSLTVKVKAVQEEMPGGMEKVMGILESLIKEEEAEPTTPPPT
jgi:hypothetical protein